MYKEIRALADIFCNEAFEAWGEDNFNHQMTAAEFISKVAEMMLLQAHTWNPEEEEDE